MPKVIDDLNAWLMLRKTINQKKSIGFVPTMGNLHIGHQSLLERARKENELTVLSIFVNPTQFNDKNDFKHYPKTFEQDIAIASTIGIDYILTPSVEMLYPEDYRYQITETGESARLEGQYRPSHFNGVLTVVLKLLSIVKPTRAYFGEKDYHQLSLIKGMVKAFFIDCEIVQCQTVRNEKGLAHSSRNNLLSSEQYHHASYFPQLLQSKKSCEEIKKELIDLNFEVDYIEEQNGRRFGAVKIGDVRLIDNVEID